MLKTIFTLAWPTMLEQFMQTAVQYIDTAMVGTLGTAATAAVGATSTVNWMVGSTVSAIGVGFLALISQAWGAGQKERARAAAAQSVSVTLLVGLFMTFLTTLIAHQVPIWMQVDPSIRQMAGNYFLILYSPMLFRTSTIILGTVLRAAGDTKKPMQIGILVNVVNIVLNFFLIYPTRQLGTMTVYGAGLGVEGAAWASAVAYAVGGVLIFLALWRHKDISPRGHTLRPDREILRGCMKVAMPNMLQRFGTSFGYVVFASMINTLGGTATAAHTIANTVESAFYIPGWGMQTAAATLAGYAYGANDRERIGRLGRTFLPLEIALMVISGGLLFFFAPPLVSLFSQDPNVIQLGTTVLKMVAVSEPFYGVPIVVEGMMQGMGRTRLPLIYNLAGMWLIRILGTFICTQLLGYGLISAWACMIGHNLLLFVLFGLTFITGKWNPLRERIRAS
ncbi:MAG: MATE family efflux transporter [Clostridia bacterium]|nr:MATE family efflux transporter [Clostridia bacterium]